MKIKAKVTPQQLAMLQEEEKRLRPNKQYLYNKYLEKLAQEEKRYQDFLDFWATNDLPIDYPPSKPKKVCNINKAYEIKPVYKSSGTVCISTREKMSGWRCPYCGEATFKKYIATGHDHTDYSYDICDCDGAAKRGGKHYSKLD